MKSSAEVRGYLFTLPQGKIKIKGLATKEKEMVVSEIVQEGDFDFKTLNAISYIKPEAIIQETELIESLNIMNIEGSRLDRVATLYTEKLAEIEITSAP